MRDDPERSFRPLTDIEVERLLTRLGFRYRIVAPNAEAAFEQINQLAGGSLTEAVFHRIVTAGVARGLFKDPIRLPDGALQCCWHLEVTPAGAEMARRGDHGGGSDEPM